MNKIVLLLLTITSFAASVYADYPVSAIPEALLKNAKLVKRVDETSIEVKNIGKAVYRHHYVYTILNEAAEIQAGLFVPYDKFRSINDISGNLYNAEGKKIKSVKRKDILDGSANTGSDLAIDDRYKYHNFYYKDYPYTIEYEVVMEMNGIFSFPEWMPQSAPLVSVENSTLLLEVPKDYKLRYKMFQYTNSPTLKESRSGKSFQWEVSNLVSKADEEYAPEWNQLVTRVLIAPTDFEIGSYKGNMETWGNFGKFMTLLYAGRDVLPASIKTRVQELTKNLGSQREKTESLYKYMQQNTRYISIQLGMGGWQPLDATYVAEKKYGDCKALSNYMVALLKEAGVKAYPALITGGSEDKDIVNDFASNQFNHVVVCVPEQKDSIWLECTSQTVEPGYMGSFTGNREALLIDDGNSHLVKTPSYTKSNNTQNRVINASVDESGTLTAFVETSSSGIVQDELHNVVHSMSDSEKKKRLRNSLSLPNYDISSFEYKEAAHKKVPAITEKVQLVSKDYASVTGKRMFITPNILSKYTKKLTEEDKRESEIFYEYGFTTSDTVYIKVPGGYTLEAAPRPLKIENQFGAYEINYSFKGEQITMIRNYERNSGSYPASAYKNMAAFYNAVFTADRARFVLVKE